MKTLMFITTKERKVTVIVEVNSTPTPYIPQDFSVAVTVYIYDLRFVRAISV